MTRKSNRAYPRDGEVFELTLRGDAPENHPLVMVECTEGGPTGWRHNGPMVTGQLTRRFKLVRVGGDCPNFQAVQEGLEAYGQHEGQWIMAFRADFSQPDGRGPIGVADASWMSPYGNAHFPYVRTDGRLNFRKAHERQSARWRWLVPAEK